MIIVSWFNPPRVALNPNDDYFLTKKCVFHELSAYNDQEMSNKKSINELFNIALKSNAHKHLNLPFYDASHKVCHD